MSVPSRANQSAPTRCATKAWGWSRPRQVKQRFVEANYTQGSCTIQGQPDSTWVAVDAGSVVIHLFDQVRVPTIPALPTHWCQQACTSSR
eukprot:9436870-Pyramimonas_sp.AAC.1